jgi:RNA polymerase sigma factor (sigma-70 family)
MTTAELTRAARGGDVDAFTRLVERYQAMAFGYALTTLRDYQLAEDAVQNAFLTAYRNLGSLRDPARFGGWLRGIVRFECLRLIRERQRTPAQSLDAVVTSPGSAQNRLEDDAITATILDQILHLLEELSEQHRLVATLYYVQNRSQASVAEFLGLPISTINNRLREVRHFLRHHGGHLMSDIIPATPDLSATIGSVLRSEGAVIEAHLPVDSRPDLLTAVRVISGERSIGAFIAQYLDDDVARLIVQPATAIDQSIAPGALVRSSGGPVTTPVDTTTIERMIPGSTSAGPPRILETGIKAIDLFAPLVKGGTVAIVGASNVGKLVVVDELLRRLAPAGHQLTILVFLRTPDETGMMHLLEYRTAGPVEVVGIPVADASPTALASSLNHVDSVLVMSRELGRKQHYPAIDPATSRSRLPTDEVVDAARRTLATGDPTNPRVVALRSYLTQPFFVAEPYTHRPGISVPLNTARADLATLLEHDAARFAGLDLLMQGSLADAGFAG